ncbi:hypothetical protein HGRIS_003696 [Hohenbuehelia grisea]|uniref:ARID domain-containing protein n=1 Tax=Hohenbuehelia grisea TaxID=104357 RepID=A0ABR3JGJ2_9AGAR
MSSYPSGLMQNFTPAMLQQQQQPPQNPQNQQGQLLPPNSMQPQQQQDGQHPKLGGMTPQDQARMWQQMQQYRSAHGMDMQQMQNPQMAELLRQRQMAQQQQQQQQSQQQFAFGVPQMGGQNPAQQPGFHEQQNGQPPQQSLMPPNFGAMGGMQAQLPARNLAAMQALQANHRQLELLNMAANQHNQNNSLAMARLAEVQRQQQQQQQQQQQRDLQIPSNAGNPSSSDIFSSPALGPDGIRRSPSHPMPQQPSGILPGSQPSLPNSMPPNLQFHQPPRSIEELKQRAQLLAVHIKKSQEAMHHLNNNRGMFGEGMFQQKMQQLQMDQKAKKEMLARVYTLMGGPGGVPNWANAAGGQGQPPNGQQPNMSNIGQANHMPPGAVPPRSGPTPLQQPPPQQSPQSQQQQQQQQREQHMASQFGASPAQMSPPPGAAPQMSPQFGFAPPNGAGANPGMPHRPQSRLQQQSPQPQPQQRQPTPQPPPQQSAPPASQQQQQAQLAMTFPHLQKPSFEGTYGNFCKSRNIQHDQRVMQLDGRQIDLHMLHMEVMKEGGASKVIQKDAWAVIGARMGFVQFPASDTEPARSGPAIAERIAHVYKEYLQAFDTMYISSVIESKRKQVAAAQASQVQNQGAGPGPASLGAGLIPPGMQGGRIPSNMISPQQMQVMVSYANQSVEQLRAQNVPEHIIHFVESNRVNLQRTQLDQSFFRQLRPQHSQMHPGQPASGGPGSMGDQMPQSAQQGMPGSGLPQGMRPPIPGALGAPFGGVQGQNNAAAMAQLQRGMPGVGPNVGPVAAAMMASRFDNTAALQQAVSHVQKIKREIGAAPQLMNRTVDVPPDQRVEYNTVIEQVHRSAQEIDNKLGPIHALLKNEETLKKLVIIILTVHHQRQLLSSSQPRFIVNLDNLRQMTSEIAKVKEEFSAKMNAFVAQQQQAKMASVDPNMRPGMPNAPLQPPSLPPSMPSQGVPINNANRQQVPPRQTPSTKPTVPNGAPSAAALKPSPMAAPTPPASTPVASSPIPAAASPQAPKSPKNSKQQKPKVPPKQTRRPSTSVKPNQSSPSIPPQQPPRPPSVSSLGKRAREEDEPASNAASTPRASGSAGAGSSTAVASEPSPPKKMKTEWDAQDGPLASEVVVKQQETIATIPPTEKEAAQFMEQMAELIKMATNTQSSTQGTELTDHLGDIGEILKGYSGDLGSPSNLGMGESSQLGGLGSPTLPAPTENFDEFFNFSSFGTLDDDDSGSKAPTPDLVESSSTNPSPASGSEADAAHHVMLADVKLEESATDSLRLGIWKEVDGGESSFFNTDGFKFEGSMPTLDWAISS